MERNLKSVERTNITNESQGNQYYKNSYEYETMLKTVNSFGSFNTSNHWIPQYPQKPHLSRIESMQLNRISAQDQNTSTFEQVPSNKNTLLLQKSSKSYPTHLHPQNSNPSLLLSRESMNLTPQLQIPSETPVQNKENTCLNSNKPQFPLKTPNFSRNNFLSEKLAKM